MKYLLPLICLFCHLTLSAQIIFYDDFEGGTLDTNFWTAQPNITGSNGIVEVVESPFGAIGNASVGNGFYSLALGKNSDSGGSTTNYCDLKLDLNDLPNDRLWLHYFIFEVRETNNPQDRIQIRTNPNSNFVTVNQHYSESWDPERWQDFPPINISEYLDFGNDLSEVTIRFSQTGSGDFFYTNEEDGFLFDNIIIWNQEQTYETLPYFNDFEDVVLATDSNPRAFPAGFWNPWPLETIGNNDASAILPSQRMRVIGPDLGFQSNNAMAISKDIDGATTFASFDFRFDLNGSDDCILEFDIYNEYTDVNNFNGIYLSTDGGATWSQNAIFSLDNNSFWEWEHYVIDIGEIISLNASLTPGSSENILRFQGVFADDLFGSSSTVDGFVIDNLEVYSGYDITQNIQICLGSSITLPNGAEVEQEGSYTSVLQSINGLDSTITTNLSYFEDALPVSYNYNICEGDSVQLSNGEYVTSEVSENVSYILVSSGCEQEVTESVFLFDETDVDYYLDGETLVIESEEALEVSWINCENSETVAGAFGTSFSPEVSGSYQAEIYNGECSTLLPCVEVEVTIINVEEKGEIELNYINPVSNFFELQSSEQIQTLIIVNSIGQQVHVTNKLNAKTFNLSTANFQAGLYTVHLSFANDQHETIRIFVK